MRITYITAGAGKMYCGSCLRDATLASALVRLGHDVTLVPTYTPLRLEEENIAIDQLFLGGINVYLQDKFSIFRHTPRFMDRLLDSEWLVRWASGFGHMTSAVDLARMTLSMLEGNRGHQLKEIRRLTEWMVSQPHPDAVLLPNTMLAGVGRAIGLRLNVPVLSFVSGEDGFIAEFPEPWRGRARRVLHHQAQYCLLIAHNESYAHHMAAFLDIPFDAFRIAPLGIDCTGHKDRPEKKQRGDSPWTIGFLARICPQKGLRQLAEALRILKQNPVTKNCRLKVGGYLAPEYRSYLDEVSRSIREWGLGDSFEYVGELERPAKMEFLENLDVFCVPSQNPEAKAQFIPEALAAGVPVIVPRVAGMTDWVEKTGGGIIVDADSPKALAEGIASMMAQDGQALEMGRRGREAVMRDHTSQKMAKAVAHIVEQVAGRNTSDLPAVHEATH